MHDAQNESHHIISRFLCLNTHADIVNVFVVYASIYLFYACYFTLFDLLLSNTMYTNENAVIKLLLLLRSTFSLTNVSIHFKMT